MEDTTKEKKSFHKKLLFIIPVVIVLLIAAGIAWLYTGTLNSTKQKVLSKIPLPAALVGNKLVPAKELITRLALAKQVASGQEQSRAATNTQIFDQLIANKKLESIASSKNIMVTSDEIDREYKKVVNQYSSGDDSKFSEELQNTFGLTPAQFKIDVLRLDIMQNNLARWFNKQESLNADAYAKAKDLQNKLGSGQKFEDVAGTYTQDAATKDFAGDSGFVVFGDLLPEFQDALKDAKANDTKLVVSRYGLHIIKVLEQDNNGDNGAARIHLQQIFVKENEFSAWLAQQTDAIKSKKLLKI